MRVSGGDLHPAGKEVVGGLRVGLEVQVNHRPGQGWVRRGTRCRGGGQPRAGSHLTGGVGLTASEEGARGLLPELPLKRLKLPVKESFSSSIRADHPFLQLNTKQKGLVFPEGTLLCRRKERATSVSYLTGRRDDHAWRGLQKCKMANTGRLQVWPPKACLGEKFEFNTNNFCSPCTVC